MIILLAIQDRPQNPPLVLSKVFASFGSVTWDRLADNILGDSKSLTKAANTAFDDDRMNTISLMMINNQFTAQLNDVASRKGVHEESPCRSPDIGMTSHWPDEPDCSRSESSSGDSWSVEVDITTCNTEAVMWTTMKERMKRITLFSTWVFSLYRANWYIYIIL